MNEPLPKIDKPDQLFEKLAGLGYITDDQRKQITCVLIGHSSIISVCYGYVYCARCGQQLGDTLAGSYYVPECVVLEHQECDQCQENMKNMGWKDKFLVDKEGKVD